MRKDLALTCVLIEENRRIILPKSFAFVEITGKIDDGLIYTGLLVKHGQKDAQVPLVLMNVKMVPVSINLHTVKIEGKPEMRFGFEAFSQIEESSYPEDFVMFWAFKTFAGKQIWAFTNRKFAKEVASLKKIKVFKFV